MEIQLTDAEVRVLGCLIEKQITTPDYYPLTLNALTAACNQKSNRDPVVDFDEKSVIRAVDGLRDKKLAWLRTAAGSRVAKYEHNFTEKFTLAPAEVAALCILMLRGPQTGGEIRGRTGRLHAFASIEEVDEVLQGLMSREAGPLVIKLPRQSGRKECRCTHLLAGEPDMQPEEVAPRVEDARAEVEAENERFAKLETETQALREELNALRQEFHTFRQQFD